MTVSSYGLTYADTIHLEQLRNLLKFSRYMTDAESPVMGWSVRIPLIHEICRAQREFVATVCVTNLQDRAGH